MEQHRTERPSVTTTDYWRYKTELVCNGVGIPICMVFPALMQGTVYRGALDMASEFFRQRHKVISGTVKRIYLRNIKWAIRNDSRLKNPPQDWFKVIIHPPRAPTAHAVGSAVDDLPRSVPRRDEPHGGAAGSRGTPRGSRGDTAIGGSRRPHAPGGGGARALRRHGGGDRPGGRGRDRQPARRHGPAPPRPAADLRPPGPARAAARRCGARTPGTARWQGHRLLAGARLAPATTLTANGVAQRECTSSRPARGRPGPAPLAPRGPRRGALDRRAWARRRAEHRTWVHLPRVVSGRRADPGAGGEP